MANIHPTAVVHKKAQIATNVEIGPYCIIGSAVQIAQGCKLHSHVVMDGDLTIGKNNQFFSFASIGTAPQDTSYRQEPTKVVIGDGNILREYVSIHRGTRKDAGITTLGDGNFIMSYVHLGHDVRLGSHCILANTVNIAGHVKISDHVTIGGGVFVSQFVSLGRGAYIGGATAIDRDIPQFCTAMGNRVRLKGINIIGLRKKGYDRQTVTEIVDFYRTMEASALSPRAFVNHEELMQDFQKNAIIEEMVDFIRKSEIGIAPFIS